jgi:predicted nucleic acid-binding protein
VTADTSVVVPALSGWHKNHEAAADALEGVVALPAHVLTEAYAVLTRLPGGLAVPPAAAAAVLASRFAEEPLQLPAAQRRTLLSTLAAAGVGGGASYDGLVALEATAHEQTLLTRDARAQDTYRRLAVAFRAMT